VSFSSIQLLHRGDTQESEDQMFRLKPYEGVAMKTTLSRLPARKAMIATLLSIAAMTSAQAQSQVFPNKPVQIITDTAIGTAPDAGLRLVADSLTQLWGQQVMVVNRPGAGGSLGARAASTSSPDGYTFYQAAMSTFLALNSSASNIPIRVPRDFLSVGIVTEIPIFFAVSPKLGISTLAEFIELAKK
jgi:tripartite-type tricarboxylate transporter receptor subunit TctC